MLAAQTAGSALHLYALAIPVLFFVLLTMGRLLKRRAGVQLGFLYVLFSFTLCVGLGLEMVSPEFPVPIRVIRAFRAANILLGVFFVLALVRRYYWELWFERHRRAKAPKFLSQILGLLLFVAAVLFVVSGVYGHSIEGVIFGSTVVVGIVGFAMQDLLGNIIAGIALEIGKPFLPGDWLIVDNQRAEVIEVNWRSTKLRNNDDVYFDIPNKSIVGANIINLTYANREHAVRLTVSFDYSASPNRVKDVLTRATAEVHGVLSTPPPKVFLKDFAESSVNYEIKFWIEDETRFFDIHDDIRTNVWYAAQRHGLRIPFPTRTLHIERPRRKEDGALEIARVSVGRHPFLQLLEPVQVEALLVGARILRFGRGENVIRQGEAGESMFILLTGEADVLINTGDLRAHVATLRPGDYCGEMALLTGEPRSATVVAQTDCELWEIAKPVFAELLKNNSALVQKLGELLAHRRMAAEGIIASETEKAQLLKKDAYTKGFMRNLYSFFEL